MDRNSHKSSHTDYSFWMGLGTDDSNKIDAQGKISTFREFSVKL